MFTRLLLAVSLAFALFTSIPVSAASVDAYTKYESAKKVAWDKYSNAKDKRYEERTKTDQAAFDKYYTFQKAELMKMRAANREKYLEWLDAKETDNYEKYLELENSVPAVSAYRKAVTAAYGEYAKIRDELYANEKKADKETYEAYTREDAEAYKQYQSQK